jgi:hypothetical protein
MKKSKNGYGLFVGSLVATLFFAVLFVVFGSLVMWNSGWNPSYIYNPTVPVDAYARMAVFSLIATFGSGCVFLYALSK